jgi:hypothetical protein
LLSRSTQFHRIGHRQSFGHKQNQLLSLQPE